MGELYEGCASVVEGNLLDWSEEFTLVKPCLEELCGDDTIISASPSIRHIDFICTASLDLTPMSFPLLPTIPSHFQAYTWSIH